MEGTLNFEGKKYISAKVAAKKFGYTSDYVGQLCRGEKVNSRLVGRVWYVLEKDIASHKKAKKDSHKFSSFISVKDKTQNKKDSKSLQVVNPFISANSKITPKTKSVNLNNLKDPQISVTSKNKIIPLKKKKVVSVEKGAQNVQKDTNYFVPNNPHEYTKSRIAEIGSQNVLYIKDNIELFPKIDKRLDLESTKFIAYKAIEDSLKSYKKHSNFERFLVSSAVVLSLFTLSSMVIFEKDNIKKFAKNFSEGSPKSEIYTLYEPTISDIKSGYISIIEKSTTSINKNNLASSIFSSEKVDSLFGWAKDVAYKFIKPWTREETVLVGVPEGKNADTVETKTIVIKENTVVQGGITQAKTVFLPSFDKEYIDTLVEEKFNSLKNYFLTSPTAPNVNRYYITRQNDAIVGRISSSGGSSSSSGSSGATDLSGLSDISLSSPAYGEVLMYDGASWVNTATSSLGISSGGGGGDFAWTTQSWGNSTSTTIGLLNGFLSTASSTISGDFRLPSLSQGFAYIGSTGKINTIASSSVNLSWFNNDAGFLTSGLSSYDAWTHPVAGRSATTSLMQFFGQASTSQFTATSSVYLATEGGNVGIGTASPSAPLEIRRNQDAATLLDIYNSTSGSGASAQLRTFSNTSSGFFGAFDSGHSIAGWQDRVMFGANSTAAGMTLTAHNSGQDIRFITGSLTGERLRITGDGNVGIGSTTPWGLLSVNANGLANGAPQFVVGSSTATNFIVANNGNVGVGTANPVAKLSVVNTSAGQLLSLDDGLGASGNSYMSVNDRALFGFNLGDGNGYAVIQGGTGKGIKFNVNNNTFGSGEAMRITSLGNVGIATATPSHKLSIFDSTAPQLSLSAGAGIAQWTFRNAGGNLYLSTTTVAGTATTSTSALTINGTTGGISLATSTAGTLKTTAGGLVWVDTSSGTAASSTLLGDFNTWSNINNFTSSIGLSTTSPFARLSINNAAGENAFVIGSSTKTDFIVNSLGRVGVGTTDLNYKFVVKTDSLQDGVLITTDSTNQPSLMLEDTSNSSKGGFRLAGGSSEVFQFGGGYGGSSLSIMQFGTDVMAGSSNAYLDINTSRFNFINGNVGVGTTSPYAKLSVVGEVVASHFIGTTTATSTFGGNLAINGTGTTTSAGGFDITGGCFAVNGTCVGGGGSGASTTLLADFNTWSNTNNFTGSIGLSTTSPFARLSIENQAGENAFVIGSSTATQFIVNSQGNVGIGDVSPASLLTVGASDAFQVNSSGRVLANFGASGAGNLAYSFVGDTDTGIYRSAADQMRFQTGGTDRITILSSGRVGVGTASPLTKFTVETASGSVDDYISIKRGATDWRIWASDGITSTPSMRIGGTSAASYAWQFDWSGATANIFKSPNDQTAQHVLEIKGANTQSGSYLNLTSSSGAAGDVMTVKPNSYLGLGTTSPYAQLSVHRNTYDTSYTPLLSLASSTASGTTTLFTVLNSGNVGIGTTSPINALGVTGSVDVTSSYRIDNKIRLLASSNYTELQDGSGTSKLHLGNANDPTNYYNNGSHIFRNSASSVEYGRFNTSGNLGIGTSSPYARLTVWGPTSGNSFEVVSSASTTNLSVSATGFGTTTVSGLNISGSATSTSNVGFNLTGGCFAVNGTCVGGGGSGASTTLLADFNTFTNTNAFTGSIGIGTTTPFAQLQISSTTASATFKPQLALSDYSAGSNSKHWTLSSQGGNFYIASATDLYATTTGMSALSILGSGYVGLGTNAPTSELQVYGNKDSYVLSSVANPNTGSNAFAAFSVRSATSDGQLAAFPDTFSLTHLADRVALTAADGPVSSAGLDLIAQASSADMRFYTGGLLTSNERVRIDSSGKVGIGSTTPLARLSVNSVAGDAWAFIVGSSTEFLKVSNTGFGTTTVRGLNIAGQATSTSNVGLNLSGGCFAINGTCVGGGSSSGASTTLLADFNTWSNTNNFTGSIGLSTTSPFARLSIENQAGENAFVIGSSTATSFLVDKNGNVGVGRTVPGSMLDVGGTAQLRGSVSGTGLYVNSSGNVGIGTTGQNARLEIRQDGGSMQTQLVLRNNNGANGSTGSRLGFGVYRDIDATSLGASIDSINTLGLPNGDAAQGASLVFNTSYDGTVGLQERMRILNTGNVGIGSTTPWGLLSVNANGLSSGAPQFVVGSSTATNFIVTNSGNVGIGIANPSQKLVVQSFDTNYALIVKNSAGTDRVKIGVQGDTPGIFFQDGFLNSFGYNSNGISFNTSATAFPGQDVGISVRDNAGMALKTNDITRATITAAGNFGIGTTTPYYGLTVASTTGAQLSLSAGAGVTQWVQRNAGGNLYFATTTVAGTATTSTSALSIIGSTGNVGIGTTTPNATLTLQGAAGINILNVATSTSGNVFTVSSWGGLVQNIASSTAVDIQNGSGTSIFTVDTTGGTTNSGIDITAGASQTGNLLNLFSSGGSYLSGFTASGAMLMNISSTTAIDIQNGSNVSVFAVDTTNKWIKLATSTSPTFTTDGQFTIGNAGTAASDGRIWIRSGATTFRFQSDNNTADYSEFFYQFEGSEAGDVLSLATKEYIDENTNASSTPPLGTGVVRKSDKGYDERLIGVYTERGTSFNNPDDDRQKNPNFANVGMLGHVLTKVTNENGEIFAGDYITSSVLFPGYGMKATESGQVIGVALGDLGDVSSTTSLTSGSDSYVGAKVMVLVSPRYQEIRESVFVLGEEDGALTGEGNTDTQSGVALVLHNQNDSGPILQLQSAGQDRLLVANNGSVKMFTETSNINELVFEINRNSQRVFSITSGGDVRVAGTIFIESDEFAGSIATDDQGLAEINFANGLGTGKPVVQLTPEGDIPTLAQVVSWKKDTIGNYIGFVLKTFGTSGQAVSANVHYAVFGKKAEYDTLNGLPVLINVTESETPEETPEEVPEENPEEIPEGEGESEVVLPGDGVVGGEGNGNGNATSTASTTPATEPDSDPVSTTTPEVIEETDLENSGDTASTTPPVIDEEGLEENI